MRTAENLVDFPKIRTSKDYIIEARSFLEDIALSLIYKTEPYSKILGGKEFIDMEIFNQHYNITQEYFATLSKGFAISMAVSYDNYDQKKELYKMIDHIKFKLC